MQKIKFLHHLSLLILVFGLPLFLFSQNSLLDQYIEEAMQQNLVLKQKNIPLAKSRLALEEAKKRFKPTADFAFTYTLALGGRAIDLPIGDLLNPVYSTLNKLTQSTQFPQVENVENQFLPNDFYDGRIRIGYPLFNKDLMLQKEVRKQEILLQENEIEIYKKELILAVKMAYYQYGLALEGQKILSNTNLLLEKSLKTVQVLVREGKVIPSQIMRAENEISLIQSKLKEAEYNVINAGLYLKFLLNRENTEELRFEKPTLYAAFPRETEGMNLTPSNPILHNIAVGLSIQSLMEKRNKQYFMPQISLFTDIGSQEFKWQFNKRSIYIMGGLQLSMPLWTNKINTIKADQIQLDIKALQSTKVLMEEQDKLALDIARNKFFSAKASFQAMEKQVNTSSSYLRLTEKGFQNGTITLLEMYDAQHQYTTALLEENIRFFQLLMALAEVQKLI
jgi:outer membrane protein TolC